MDDLAPPTETAPRQRRSAAILLLIAALLLLMFFIRVYHIMAMPAFNDESLHIRRSEIVWSFDDPATSFTVGKLLGYYWLGAFGFDRLVALHGGRLVHALFVLIGAAASYRVGKSLFNHAVGLLALLLVAVAPYLVFYERMILADQLAAAFGMLTIWASIRLARRPTKRGGLLAGLFISLAILCKSPALPFAAVPLVAIVLLGHRPRPAPAGWLARVIPRHYWPALVTLYSFNLFSGFPFMLFPIFREVTNEPVLLLGENLVASSGFHRVFAENLPRLWDLLTVYFGLVAVLVALVLIGGLVVRARRSALYLILCTLLPWSVVLLISPDPSFRYWHMGIPPLLVLVAAALWQGGVAITRRGVLQYAPIALVLIWIAAWAGPFIRAAWNDPLAMRLPDHDRWEYFENFASGYGLYEATQRLPDLPVSDASDRVPVIGLVGSCHLLRLYLAEDGPVDLSCPFFGWQGEYMNAVVQHIMGRLDQESVLYMLVEPELRFTDLSVIPVHWHLIERFPRPWGGMAVELYAISFLDGEHIAVRAVTP